MYIVGFFPSLLRRDIWPFTRVAVHWRKGNNQTFHGILDTDSELTRIPGDPEHHCGPPGRAEAYKI